MHTYATNSPHQPRLVVWLVFASIGITVAIGSATSWIKTRWGFQLGGTSSMAVFGALYFAFDRWLWRWRHLRALLLVPNLNGTWLCKGKTVSQQGNASNHEWAGEVCITQSWSRIKVVLRTDKSISRSIAASLYREDGEGYRLIYHYENAPGVDHPGLHRHAGLCDLSFADDLTKANGQYFTDIARLTVGTMTLTRKDQ